MNWKDKILRGLKPVNKPSFQAVQNNSIQNKSVKKDKVAPEETKPAAAIKPKPVQKNKNLLHDFIKAVNADKNSPTEYVCIHRSIALPMRDYAEARIEAARKGGRTSRRPPVDLTEKGEKNRERVRRNLKKKKLE